MPPPPQAMDFGEGTFLLLYSQGLALSHQSHAHMLVPTMTTTPSSDEISCISDVILAIAIPNSNHSWVDKQEICALWKLF